MARLVTVFLAVSLILGPAGIALPAPASGFRGRSAVGPARGRRDRQLPLPGGGAGPDRHGAIAADFDGRTSPPAAAHPHRGGAGTAGTGHLELPLSPHVRSEERRVGK